MNPERQIQVLCPCGKKHVLLPSLVMSASEAAAAHAAMTDEQRKACGWHPASAWPSAPQDIVCGCGMSYAVIWWALNRDVTVGHQSRRRGRVRVVVGPRATVRAYKGGALVGAWVWINDRFARGKLLLEEAVRDIDRNRRERLADMAAAKSVGEVREIKAEIDRLDRPGSRVRIARPRGGDTRSMHISERAVVIVAYPGE